MQAILLKKGFEYVFSSEFLEKVTQENEFIYLDSNELNISSNLDLAEMYGSPFGNDEKEFAEVVSELLEKLPLLKEYFIDDFFEIVFFQYNGEYTATMYQLKDGKLKYNSGWIGEFCSSCEDIEDEDEKYEEQGRFVDENTQDLKDGYPSQELLDGLIEGLYEV
jgi:hypothetical protein